MAVTVKTLVVGGGASGGNGDTVNSGAGGGGAGGYLYDATHTISASTYAITVGVGGPTPTGGSNQLHGINGGNSVFDTLTAIGGGGGGGGHAGSSGFAQSGGSGGGECSNSLGGGGTGTVGQGHNGNLSSGNNGGSGGGSSGNPTGTSNSITGSAVIYATGGAGGADGGGTKVDGVHPGDAGNGNNYVTGAGAGHDGTVIISYASDGSNGITTNSTGGSITTSGGQTIHTFTSNGTFTPDYAITTPLSTGIFILNGSDTLLGRVVATLTTAVGQFVLTGIDIGAKIGGYLFQTKHTDTFTNQNKSTDSFNNQSKSSSTWTDQIKNP